MHKPLGRRLGVAGLAVFVSGIGLLAPVVTHQVTVTQAAGSTLATSSSAQAYQRSAQDKVAYLHDGSLLVGYFDGSKGVITQVKNPSTAPATQQVQTISAEEVTLYTQPSSNSTDIWIQAGAELVGSAPLEQVRHGVYNGTTFTWDAVTTIPGTTAPGRQDPSVTWTGKWLIASWWDDTLGSNSDQLYVNWTSDKSGTTGWLSTAILLTTTGPNIVQVSIRHSAKLGATIAVYGGHCRMWFRTLLDSKTDPSLGNWSTESMVDPTDDDCEFGFGGPQIAIDESTGKIHVFRAVTNSQGTARPGITYWLGTPDAVPMSTGAVTWNSRLVIDNSGTTTDPPDIAGAVDSAGKVYVFWTTSVSSGAIKYVTLVSPFTSASSATTLATTGTQPRYPHVPAQAPLSGGIVPLVYQSGTSSPFNLVLDTSLTAASGDTTPPSIPTGLRAVAISTSQVNLSWNASTDNVGVTGYTVYRNGTTLATVNGSTLTYADTAVAGNTTYTYAVDAFDAAGNRSAQSIAAVITTPGGLAAPTGVGATAGDRSATVTWTAPASDGGSAIASYTVTGNPGGSQTLTCPCATLQAIVGGLSNGTAYTFTVHATNGVGRGPESTASNSVTPAMQSSPLDLGGALIGGPDASATSASKTDVFVRGTDNQLWHKSWNGTAWGNWEPLGGVLTADPGAVAAGAASIDVFVRGSDKQLWENTWNGSAWTGWQPLAGILTSGPDADSWTTTGTHVDVFVRGTDNGLWHKWSDSGIWSVWEPLGGSLTSDPGAVSWGPNRADVFVRGTDNQLWHKWWDGIAWRPWEALGGGLASGPDAASCASGHLDVFVIGTDGQLWRKGYNGTSWGQWQSLGGTWVADPGAVCHPGGGTIDVYTHGANNALWTVSVPAS